jgi:antitoxin CcdA
MLLIRTWRIHRIAYLRGNRFGIGNNDRRMPMSMPTRRPTSLHLRRDLLAQAKLLGVNVASAAEAGIAGAVKAEHARRWQETNAAAIRSYNDYVKAEGLPAPKRA